MDGKNLIAKLSIRHSLIFLCVSRDLPKCYSYAIMLNFVFFSAFIINESAVLVQVHKHRHAGEAWLTVIREKPMRLRKDQSDLIYSQRSQVVTPIKSSGLMLPPLHNPRPRPNPSCLH